MSDRTAFILMWRAKLSGNLVVRRGNTGAMLFASSEAAWKEWAVFSKDVNGRCTEVRVVDVARVFIELGEDFAKEWDITRERLMCEVIK